MSDRCKHQLFSHARPPDLDKNMLREALLASVNEEGGSGPYCILILYQWVER